MLRTRPDAPEAALGSIPVAGIAADWGAASPAARPWARRPEVVRTRSTIAGLVSVDASAALLAGVLGVAIRFHNLGALDHVAVMALLPPAWLLIVLVCGAYDSRLLAAGAEEFRRVANAGLGLFTAIACVSFAWHLDLSRGTVLVSVPLVTGLSLCGRYLARGQLHRLLLDGRCLHRVVVVGDGDELSALVRHFSRAPHAGLKVVGACTPGGEGTIGAGGSVIPVLGGLSTVAEAVREAEADTIALAGGSALPAGALRRLSWQLEGTGIRLIVAPTVTDVAGPRIVVRPVNGLPLLHVEEPEFSGPQRLLKEGVDRIASAALLVLLSPVILGVTLLVRATSPGPALFRQVRVGLRGEPFVMLKFRTMRVGAHADAALLAPLNQAEGPLFKMRTDPRVTSVGRWLRRFSLDELPQLLNVVGGSMSLVGPRPPLPQEVERYGSDTHRRLLVKPGITGLWQVSGRSDLPWDEAERLDLYYVDNWSLTLDILLMWRTVFAVLSRRGAY